MATHKYIYTVQKKEEDINIHTNKYKQTPKKCIIY